jgi:hypothetical protein
MRGLPPVESVEERQQAWEDLAQRGRTSSLRSVASRAVDRYGLILNELLADPASCADNR